MPAPARTSLDSIRRHARATLERGGLEGLTMQAVALAVGVRAPSLYKHVRDRGELIRLVANDVAEELGRRLDETATGTADPGRRLRALFGAFRAFALASPHAYGLLFAQLPEEWRPDPGLNLRAVAPVLAACEELVGNERRLDAARTAVAFANGFVSMELAGAFRLGGDVEAAWEYGLDSLLRAFATPSRRGSRA